MSMRPQAIPPVPETTAATARAAFPRGNRYLSMRDELGVFYRDLDFAALFPTRGQPAQTPWRLALVLVMQFAEGLSDAQAAEAVRGRIDWKYALSLELNDPGFDASVLSEFRGRLVEGNAERQLLDVMLNRLKEAGLLQARGRQRTDSTHVLAAVRALNRLACVGETLRHALNTLAVIAPEWLALRVPLSWGERYEQRFEDTRLPRAETKRVALAETIGRDGVQLLQALQRRDAPVWVWEVPAIETLRRVWVQQFHAAPPGQTVRWRGAADAPPASRMIRSPYDVEARFGRKRTTEWTGYKVHLSETCDAEGPHVITNVETTTATTQDWDVLPRVHEALERHGLLPSEHLMDAGYVDAGLRVESQKEYGVTLVGPAIIDHSWQAREGTGFAVADFVLDWEARFATCPQGAQSRKWSATHHQQGRPIINIRFDPNDCTACETRTQCTRSRTGPRNLTVQPRARHEALQEARQYQKTAAFEARYRARAGVEGTISQGVTALGLRRARYKGLAKVHLQHVLTAAAINLQRVGDYLADVPAARTRTPPFVALVRAAA